ncbi:MAG: class I SAM-dependent methyltransferase [Curvibacter sp.]|nr:class I SAM-dependent methyltransferase [Curvibacter sp.]
MPRCLEYGLLLSALLAFGGCASQGAGAPGVAGLDTQGLVRLVASPDRNPQDRTLDARRHPVELLNFIGVRPGMTVLDISAGGGYTTDLLARAVGTAGHVYGQSAPPAAAKSATASEKPASATTFSAGPGPQRRSSAEALAERALKPRTANIVPVVRPFDDLVPEELADAKLDLATLMFNYHDLGHLGVDRAKLNEAVFKALKPGGLYVIADHAGRPGTGISESGTLHRIEESFLRQEVEAAGFKLAAEGQFLRNPADPRDGSPVDAKDEFVLKFVKP